MGINQIPKPDGMTQLASANVCGIYFLWLGQEIVYVGQSRAIHLRILQHLEDRTKKFDGLSFIVCHPHALNKRERYFIEALTPRYNACRLAARARKEKPWMAERRAEPQFMGLTIEQLNWARSQFGAPKQIRIPRHNVRRWAHAAVVQWATANPAQFAAAKEFQAN
jgi:hypothetical protein